jgi:hypothetical protein
MEPTEGCAVPLADFQLPTIDCLNVARRRINGVAVGVLPDVAHQLARMGGDTPGPTLRQFG